jgi:hypothetical protein
MLAELLKYTLPAFFVFLATYLVIYKFMSEEKGKRRTEAILNNQKIITPVRLQAYERMVLFLERISLQSLVIRSQKPNITCQDLQNQLLKNIRSEFEHNMAHQLYISDKAWEMIRSAKENCVKYINQTALQVKPDAPAINLSKLILENMLDQEKDPTSKAINYLKAEVRELF